MASVSEIDQVPLPSTHHLSFSHLSEHKDQMCHMLSSKHYIVF